MDVMRYPSCSGRLSLVVVLSDPALIDRYSGGVSLATTTPAVVATRLLPQRELDLVY